MLAVGRYIRYNVSPDFAGNQDVRVANIEFRQARAEEVIGAPTHPCSFIRTKTWGCAFQGDSNLGRRIKWRIILSLVRIS